jgi:Ca2+-binding EF-hand superfamily protein
LYYQSSSLVLSSGFISVAEMLTVLGTVYGLEGVSQAEATQRVKFIFGLLDTDGDEEISEEEFIRGCLEDQELVKLLQP